MPSNELSEYQELCVFEDLTGGFTPIVKMKHNVMKNL